MTFHFIYGMSSSQVTFTPSFFRGVGGNHQALWILKDHFKWRVSGNGGAGAIVVQWRHFMGMINHGISIGGIFRPIHQLLSYFSKVERENSSWRLEKFGDLKTRMWLRSSLESDRFTCFTFTVQWLSLSQFEPRKGIRGSWVFQLSLRWLWPCPWRRRQSFRRCTADLLGLGWHWL